jgi:hypothetical protein
MARCLAAIDSAVAAISRLLAILGFILAAEVFDLVFRFTFFRVFDFALAFLALAFFALVFLTFAFLAFAIVSLASELKN